MTASIVFADRILRAIDLAIRYHGDQKYGDLPYIYHLVGVARRVLQHGGTEDQIIAAILHDSLEDTKLRFEEVHAAFGPRITAMVVSLTHDPDMSNEEYIGDLIDDAVLIKLCDSEFNLDRLKNATDMSEARRFKLKNRYVTNLSTLRERLPAFVCISHSHVSDI